MARTVGFAEAMVPPGMPSRAEQAITPTSGISTSRISAPVAMEIAMLATTTSFRLQTRRMTLDAKAASIMTMVGSVEIRMATFSWPG